MMCVIVRASGALLAAGELPGLALGCDRWRDDHLYVVHLADRARPEGRHRLSQGADEVLRAVGRLGGAEEDLLERQALADPDPGPARERWRRGGHPPVVATP